jgi:hypothetical protein
MNYLTGRIWKKVAVYFIALFYQSLLETEASIKMDVPGWDSDRTTSGRDSERLPDV